MVRSSTAAKAGIVRDTNQSVKLTEKFYAAWTAERQRQAEADLERAWERDPIVLQQGKNMLKLHGKTEFVN
jgi:hypothetical protein